MFSYKILDKSFPAINISTLSYKVDINTLPLFVESICGLQTELGILPGAYKMYAWLYAGMIETFWNLSIALIHGNVFCIWKYFLECIVYYAMHLHAFHTWLIHCIKWSMLNGGYKKNNNLWMNMWRNVNAMKQNNIIYIFITICVHILHGVYGHLQKLLKVTLKY